MTVTSISGSPLAGGGQKYSVERPGVTVANFEIEMVRTPGCMHLYVFLPVPRPGDRMTAQASENGPQVPLGNPVVVVVGARGQAVFAALLRGSQAERDLLSRFTRDGPALDRALHVLDRVEAVEPEPCAVMPETLRS